MTKSIDSLQNSSTFGDWKDITNAMGDGFDEVLTLGDDVSINNGNLALTGDITSNGTLTVGTITHGTLVDITKKTNIAETLQIVKSGSAAQLWFAKTHDALDAWKVLTADDSGHNLLTIQKTVGVTTKSFTFNYSSGSITASGFNFDTTLLPQTITGNAGSATKWAAAATITLGGDASGNVSLDGSADVALTVTVANNSHTHTQDNITDLTAALTAKLATAGGTLTGNTKFNDDKKLSFGTGGIDDSAFHYNSSNILITDLGINCTEWQIRHDNGDSSFTTRFTFSEDGDLLCDGDITAFSDRTLKENIISIPNALDKVCAIGGYTYDRTDIVRDRQTGVIAQEVLEVLPEAVHQNEDGIYSVAYGNMVGLLVEAIKELKSEIDELRSNA